MHTSVCFQINLSFASFLFLMTLIVGIVYQFMWSEIKRLAEFNSSIYP